MDYTESLKPVLLRKIRKAEQDLIQLKLDYCRFVFGLNHRSSVQVGGRRFRVHSVNVDSMKPQPDGSFSRPELTAIPLESLDSSEVVTVGSDWTLN